MSDNLKRRRELLEKKLINLKKKEAECELFGDIEYCKKKMNEALINSDQSRFLLVLRSAVMARGGMAPLSKATGINRESLYKILCEDGNPRLDILSKILEYLGLMPAGINRENGERVL